MRNRFKLSVIVTKPSSIAENLKLESPSARSVDTRKAIYHYHCNEMNLLSSSVDYNPYFDNSLGLNISNYDIS